MSRKMKKSTGIVMRTRDRPLLLRRALESVLGQSCPRWRLTIVNDGGEKEPVDALVAEYENRLDGRARVLHRETSQGMQNASNAAIRLLETDYLVVHDDDDSWEPPFLEKTVRFLEQAPPGTKGVITLARKIVEKIENGTATETERSSYNGGLTEVNLFQMLGENRFPPISFVFEKAAYEAAGPFREACSILGDWDFNIRFLLRFDIGLIPEELANYHFRTADDTSAYGNTVTSGLAEHVYFDNRLRNQWLREELEKGALGRGALACLSKTLKDQHDYAALREKKLGALEHEVKSRAGALEFHLKQLEERITRLEAKLGPMDWLARNMEPRVVNMEGMLSRIAAKVLRKKKWGIF